MDMEAGQDIYLKNVTQIGTPGRGGKIYIADEAYARVHMDEFRDMRVFVLMGHTECSSGKYTTFIEAAIPVEDISFIRNTPVWTNKVWNRVYQEIKRTYESMIIVGWAFDQKGIIPKVNYELESVHREHFGGTNQVLLLLDTEAQEEVFYLSKNNHLYAKDGFYIYYGVNRKKTQQTDLSLELPPETKISSERVRELSMESRGFSRKVRDEDYYTDAEDAWDMKTSGGAAGHQIQNADNNSVSDAQTDMNHYRRQDSAGESGNGTTGTAREQYRKMMESQYGHRKKEKRGGNTAAAAVALLLVAGIAWTALKKNPESAEKLNAFIETISNGVSGNVGTDNEDADYVIRFSTEADDKEDSSKIQENSSEESEENTSDMLKENTEESSAETNENGTETTSASGDVIPVEEVDGGIGENQ